MREERRKEWVEITGRRKRKKKKKKKLKGRKKFPLLKGDAVWPSPRKYLWLILPPAPSF